MVEKVKAQRSMRDALLWLLIVVLVGAGIVANLYFREVEWSLRVAAGIVVTCCLFGVAGFTSQGRATWGFIKEARAELRKVTWPNRQETVQVTMIVALVVVLTALVLWGMDSTLMWAMSRVTT